jgi:5-methylcytosine-specific restriction endonuclease McrA
MTLAVGNNAVSVVASSVLVLNRFYMAVHVVNVRRAIALLFRDLAEVIHIEDNRYANYDFVSWQEISALRAEYEDREPDEDWIRSVNFQLQVPRIIRLLNYDRVPKQRLRFNRRNVFARDRNQCQYCGQKVHSTRPNQVAECSHEVTLTLGDAVAGVLKAVGIRKRKGCKCGKRQRRLNEAGRWIETELRRWT